MALLAIRRHGAAATTAARPPGASPRAGLITSLLRLFCGLSVGVWSFAVVMLLIGAVLVLAGPLTALACVAAVMALGGARRRWSPPVHAEPATP